LQGWRSIRGWQDVSLDEIIAVRAGIEALLEVVGCTLALELKSFGLQSTGMRSAECTQHELERAVGSLKG
jgi:hypothetical protein